MSFLTTTHRRMTASEYFEMPEGPPYFQLVHGELFMSPSPVIRHQKVLLKLASRISVFLEDHPFGEVFIAPSDVQLGEGDVYQPDIYYVSREHLGIFDKQGAKGAPDLVVEVLSPSTARLDRQMKREIYQSAGVAEIWFINLWYDQIEVHRFIRGEAGAVITTLGVEDELSTPLLPGWKMAVKKVLF